MKINSWILALAYMCLIFILSSFPLEFPEVVDKLDPTKFSLHVVEYSILGLLLFKASRNFKASTFVGIAYGLSDEIHQYFVPFRTFSLFDWLADTIGVILGILIFMKIEGKFDIKLF